MVDIFSSVASDITGGLIVDLMVVVVAVVSISLIIYGVYQLKSFLLFFRDDKNDDATEDFWLSGRKKR